MAHFSFRLSQSMPHVLLGFLILLLPSLSNSLDISYCSPDNTGADSSSLYSIYQSDGLCQTHCQDSYAYAVIQGDNCWCSDYAPSDQEDTSSCDEPCPGYLSDWCGSTSAGLFGYYDLGIVAPSGTAGTSSSIASSSSISSTSSTTSSPSVSTILSTPGSSSFPSPSTTSSSVDSTPSGASLSSLVTVAPPQSSVQTSSSVVVVPSSTAPVLVSSATASSSTVRVQSTTFVVSTSSPSPTPTPTSTTSPSPSPSPSPSSISTSPQPSSSSSSSSPAPTHAYTSVTTVTGQVRTIIITPTASADPALGQGATNGGGGGGVSTGRVVGIVLGVALSLGLIIGLAVWFWLRRKHANNIGGVSPDGTYTRESVNDPSRTPPSRQVSQMSSSGLLGKRPRLVTAGLGPSNNPRSADTASSGFDRRSLGTDQRLNPNALYAHEESRHSNVSLQDNQDYSRQLRVANPDL